MEDSTQVPKEIQDSVIEKLSQDFSQTEFSILGALAKLDKFLLNPQVRTLFRTVPGTHRNNNTENWEPAWTRSENDPYPEV